MALFNFDPATFFSFFLTFLRVSLIVFVLPFFGGTGLPMTVKPAMCMLLSFALWPHLKFSGALFPSDIWSIMLMIAGELIMGLVMNMIVRFVFSAIESGGSLISTQMGLSMANVLDPLTGSQDSVTGHFLSMIAMLTFLALNGHLFILDGLAKTFELVPPGRLLIGPALQASMFSFSSQIFVLAIQIASPILVAIFLVDLGLALVSRAAPQMNILSLGFPLKIAVGFLFLGMLFTIMARYVGDFIGRMGPIFDHTFKAM